MDEHTNKCNPETGINKEKVKKIKYIVPLYPKEKQGTSPVESPILLQREIYYGLQCTTTEEVDMRNKSFPSMQEKPNI